MKVGQYQTWFGSPGQTNIDVLVGSGIEDAAGLDFKGGMYLFAFPQADIGAGIEVGKSGLAEH